MRYKIGTTKYTKISGKHTVEMIDDHTIMSKDDLELHYLQKLKNRDK